jgi:hypothetical protein
VRCHALLYRYYHGNSARFASVMMASTPPTPSLTTTSATSIVKKKVFDATIHVRTLELLEGQQLNGHGTCINYSLSLPQRLCHIGSRNTRIKYPHFFFCTFLFLFIFSILFHAVEGLGLF